MHIMVVEDDKAIRETLKEILNFEGHEVRAAASGEEALDSLLNSELPDLILLDQMMPEMSGMELLARIEADPKLNSVPVILTSGMNEAQDSSKLFLRKPFTLEDLDALLRKCKTRCTDIGTAGFAIN